MRKGWDPRIQVMSRVHGKDIFVYEKSLGRSGPAEFHIPPAL